MVCISYLDIGGTPAHLRHLMPRLRARLPSGVPVLVGLWPAQDPILMDADLRRALGADYYAPSLHEAVQACLAQARASAPRPSTATRSKTSGPEA